MIDYWVSEITLSKKFYEWLKQVIDMRYSVTMNNDEGAALVDKADELINYILGTTLPEVDADAYSTRDNVGVKEFAETKAAAFQSMASNNDVELS